MTHINITTDATQDISKVLYEVMDKKGILEPITHAYLTELMADYVGWTDDEFTPSVHTKKTEAFVLQLGDARLNASYTPTSRYQRFKAIGDTLLVAIGYWPESLSTIRRDISPEVVNAANERAMKEAKGKFCKISEFESVRQPLLYYAAAGVSAYKNAASYGFAVSRQVQKVMDDMACRFKQHAAVLHELRNEFSDVPLQKIEVILELAELLGDETVMKRFLLSLQNPEIVH